MKKKINKLWRKALKNKGERGSALIVVTLILALLTIYISAALTTTTTDAISSNFSVQQQRAFFGAYSKMEQMTGDFSTLFLTSLNPTYDSMCRAVISDPVTIKNILNNQDEFTLNIPPVTCPDGANCTPGSGYTTPYTKGTDLFDLGWEGDPIITPPGGGFCIVDVCNPSLNNTVCNFPPKPTKTVAIQSGDYAGLQGFGRRFRMVATASSANLGGVDVQITRDFTNYLLPVFQFGIFTDADFELYIPPLWTFGGWVHTNSDFYATGNKCKINGVDQPCNVFSQYAYNTNGDIDRTAARITVAKHMVIGDEKGGDYYLNGSATDKTDGIRVYESKTTFQDYDVGTVKISAANQGANVTNCNSVSNPSEDSAAGTCGSFKSTNSGTIKTGVRPLRLPIQNLLGANPIELIRRGLPTDYAPAVSSPLLSTRYYYKPGLRITLADYQSQLPRQVLMSDVPGQGTGPYGGIQLDGPDPVLGNLAGTGNQLAKSSGDDFWYYREELVPVSKKRYFPIPRGYQPKVADNATTARPTGARINGNRIHGWIKVEIVKATGLTFDITEEILNLGVTVPYLRYGTDFSKYYPRPTPGFPATLPLAYSATDAGPYPDENSIIHLQRMAIPYKPGMDNTSGRGFTPADLKVSTSTSSTVSATTLYDMGLDDVTSSVTFDYYASMNLRDYNSTNDIKMYGIRDDKDDRVAASGAAYPLYGTKFAGKASGANNTKAIAPFAEPQPDLGGYYTDFDDTDHSGLTHGQLPANANNGTDLKPTVINFTAADVSLTSNPPNTRPSESTNYIDNAYNPNKLPLSENANLPKARGTGGGTASVVAEPESTWKIFNSTGFEHLVPFPINMYDSREGIPNVPDPENFTFDPPISDIPNAASPNKAGTINLVELDMGNLGRLLTGDFNTLFSLMGDTAFSKAAGHKLTHLDIRDNIDINQDNGWIVYFSDRRGDEPVVSTNQNYTTSTRMNYPSSKLSSTPNTGDLQSIIGDGNYAREDVIWSGNSNPAGSTKAIPVKFGGNTGCNNGKTPYSTDNQDPGKSPQDSNNDCYVQTEGGTNSYSETADYGDIFNSDAESAIYLPIDATTGTGYTKVDPSDSSKNKGLVYSVNGSSRMVGAAVAMTQVPTNPKPTWSLKPPTYARTNKADFRTELFRRGLRLVNAGMLFPDKGQDTNSTCGALLGVSVTSESPVYVFGNYNAPLGKNIDVDSFPGISGSPDTPTSPKFYNGAPDATNTTNIHVPAAIVADAITFISNPCVGDKNSNWSGTTAGDNVAGWMDARSFISPYQALAARPARNTVYRFALISGYTPSWYKGYWGNDNWNQGYDSSYSSGALNNFPRFLEDWGQNATSNQYVTYAGSLIRMFKSRQGNGAFKRNGSGSNTESNNKRTQYDAVYRPPQRDWVFDLDFTQPCTLPPGTPFLQLIDFKGFQQSTVQQR